MMKWLFLFVVLTSNLAWAVPVVVYDQDGKVTDFGDVEGTHAAPPNSIVLDNPNDSHVPTEKATYQSNLDTFSDLRRRGIPMRYWKVEVGLLKEMAQSEKDAVDAPIIAARQKAQDEMAELAQLRNEVDATYLDWDNALMDKVAAVKKLIRVNQLERNLGLQ